MFIQGGMKSYCNVSYENTISKRKPMNLLIYKMIFSLCVFLVLILLNTGKAYAISGTVSAPSTTRNGSIQVKVTLNGSASNCAVAVWSQRNGQDDLKWYWNYSAASSYTFNINLANHDSVNNAFEAHVYVNNQSQMIGSSHIVWIPSNFSISSSVPAYTRDGKITVTVTSNYAVADGCTFPTWRHNNDQKDLVWYNDTSQKTNYSYTINLANHGVNGQIFWCDVYAFVTAYKVSSNYIIWDGTGPTITASNINYGSNLSIKLKDSAAGVRYFGVTKTNSAPSGGTGSSDVTTGSTLNYWYRMANSNTYNYQSNGNFNSITVNEKTVTFTGLEAGTYYVWAQDAAGNSTSKAVTVNKAASTNPTLTSVSKTYDGSALSITVSGGSRWNSIL